MRKKSKTSPYSTILGIAATIIILLSAYCVLFPPKIARNCKIIIAGQEITAETASSPRQRYQGLSRRPNLCPDCGMLFIFPDKLEREFVMRDMEFPLDIVFIADGHITNISAMAEPEGDNPAAIYRSVGPADQVLELNGGYCVEKGIKIGDVVNIIAYHRNR